MTDSTVNMETTAYSYGCPAWYDLPPEFIAGQWQPGMEEAGEHPEGQLSLANRLWNRLVEIHRAHEEAKDAVWASVPAVAAAQEVLDDAETVLSDAYERIRASRRADRSTVPRGDDRAALEAAREAREAAKLARDAARKAALPSLREAFAAAKQARFATVKATYSLFTLLGLGWGTYNDVTRRRFAAAAAKVEAQRSQGRPADLRFRRFDGTGTLTVQVMGGAGIGPRTVPALNSGRHPRSGVFRLEPWTDPAQGRPKGKARHGTLHLTVGRSREAGPLRLEIHVVLDRYLPADADIREVKVTRFREGSHYRVKVSVICSQPARAPETGAGVVAVRLSWRSAGDGRVTVAHVGAPHGLPPTPPSLAGVVRVSQDGQSAEVMYAPEWRRVLERDEGIRSVRSQNVDVLRGKVAAALREDAELSAALGVTAGEVSRWEAPRRFAVLARRWPAAHPLAGVLEEWRARDRHLWDYEAHESAQVLGARRDAWRCAAKWLCSAASALVIDGADLAREKRAPGPGREDPEGARGARRLMHGAAPGEFREALEAAAARRAIPVTMVKKAEETGS